MMPYVKLFRDLRDVVDGLTDEEAGRLFKAVMHYANGETDQLPGQERLVFIMLKAQIDRDQAKYDGYIQKQRENGKKSQAKPSLPKPSQAYPSLPKPNQEKEEEKEKEKDKEEDKDKEKEIRPYKGRKRARALDYIQKSYTDDEILKMAVDLNG